MRLSSLISDDRYIFMDMEFNTVKKINEIISVGVIICDKDLNIIDKFYSYVRLSMTNKMDAYCTNLTKIKDIDLEDAPSFNTVFSNLINFLSLTDNDSIFVWGDYDKQVLTSNISYHNSFDNFDILLNSIVDIQPYICKNILLKGEMISERISLQDVKEMCSLKGRVVHNALEDTIDLKNIFSKFIEGNIDERDILKVYSKNKEKKDKQNNQKEFLRKYSNDYPNGVSVSKLDKKMIQHIKKLCKLKDTNFRKGNPSLNFDEDVFIIKTDLEEITFNSDSKDAIYNFKIQGNKLHLSITINEKEFKFIGKCTYTTQGLVGAILKKSLEKNNIKY